MTFDGNDYRKRVLAAVHRRGGPDGSDAFELYDVTLDETSDDHVRRQVDEVWAFWQRSRDHPKYGTLCGLLVEGHEQRSWELIDAGRRTLLARRVRTARTARDAARYELLDTAVRRLVERHRGVPRDKVDGLVELGALHGLTADEVRSRLRMHRLVDVAADPSPPAAAAAVTDTRRHQVRALLDEFGRLNETPAPPTLFALLGLGPDADERDLAQRAAAWRERVRELPPLRIRAVADELMVHVRDLLEAGPIVRAGYLDTVAADVADALRPRVRAAVLVEDRLVADDHDHLLEEAEALGLDLTRARAVLAGLAAELGAAVESRGGAPPAALRRSGAEWEHALRSARAALRAGRLLEAERLAADASRTAGVEGATPARAVSDEIAEALAAARLRWRAATTALGAHRFAEAVEHLEHLTRAAVDVPGPTGASAPAELSRARGEVAAADGAVAAAGADTVALIAVLERWPEHPPAVAALAAAVLDPPSAVTVARDRAGTVVISWCPSPTPHVTYRVSRLGPDGAPRVVGRTPGTLLEDGGAPPGPLATYAVAALLARRASAEARSDEASAPPLLAAPTEVRAYRAADGTVRVTWAGAPDAEFKISRVTEHGSQVVGRTRRHAIEDGGAPADLPTYVVTASRDGETSAEATT